MKNCRSSSGSKLGIGKTEDSKRARAVASAPIFTDVRFETSPTGSRFAQGMVVVGRPDLEPGHFWLRTISVRIRRLKPTGSSSVRSVDRGLEYRCRLVALFRFFRLQRAVQSVSPANSDMNTGSRARVLCEPRYRF